MSAMVWYQCTTAGLTCLSVALEQTSLSTLPAPSLRALAYGDGFFTTIGVYQSKLLWQRYHDARLSSHAQALHLYLAPAQRQQLWQAVTAFANDIEHGLIKIIVGRQTQALRGYAYSADLSDNRGDVYIGVMQTPPLATTVMTILNTSGTTSLNTIEPILQQSPVTAVCLTAQLACLPKPLVGLKSLNRLDSVLVAGELETYKRDNTSVGEGLVQDITGDWVEGVMSNVFYQVDSETGGNLDVKGSFHEANSIAQVKASLDISDEEVNYQWFTPPLIASGVRGVLRQVIVDKFALTETPIQCRTLHDKDLGAIKSMFFCNAVRGIIPVDKLILPSGQVLVLSLDTFIQ